MRLQAVTKLLRSDDLLRHGAILAGAAVVNGGLNYAFQLFMGRALRPEVYGVFGVGEHPGAGNRASENAGRRHDRDGTADAVERTSREVAE